MDRVKGEGWVQGDNESDRRGCRLRNRIVAPAAAATGSTLPPQSLSQTWSILDWTKGAGLSVREGVRLQ